jgi:hypothetical protein
VGLSTVLTVSQFLERPGRSALGLLIVLAGYPIYRILAARRAGVS